MSYKPQNQLISAWPSNQTKYNLKEDRCKIHMSPSPTGIDEGDAAKKKHVR